MLEKLPATVSFTVPLVRDRLVALTSIGMKYEDALTTLVQAPYIFTWDLVGALSPVSL
jgi:hypothetical protein